MPVIGFGSSYLVMRCRPNKTTSCWGCWGWNLSHAEVVWVMKWRRWRILSTPVEFRERGSQWEKSAPYGQGQDHHSISERPVRTILEQARTMLIHIGSFISSWPKAIAAACYITNCLSTKALVIHLMDLAVRGNLIRLTFASKSAMSMEGWSKLWSFTKAVMLWNEAYEARSMRQIIPRAEDHQCRPTSGLYENTKLERDDERRSMVLVTSKFL